MGKKNPADNVGAALGNLPEFQSQTRPVPGDGLAAAVQRIEDLEGQMRALIMVLRVKGVVE